MDQEPLRLRPHNDQVTSIGQVAQRAYSDDAGIDLYVAPNWTGLSWQIDPGEFVDIDLGVDIQLPAGHWGLITGRSSTLRQRGLLVNQGIIDHGWRGPLFAGVFNLTSQPVFVEAGARIAQLIVLPTWGGHVELAEALDDHPRGTRGFGSSGR